MARASTDADRHVTEPTERTLWAIVIFCAVLFSLLLTLVWHVRGPITIDNAVGGRALGYSWAWHRIAFLGSPPFVFTALLALATIAYAWRDNVGVVVCIIGPALAGLCELIAKQIVDRKLGSVLSYPSGHVTLAAALATAAVLVAYRTGGARAAVAATAPSAVLAVLVSVAVVRLGWHYPTDALGGAALGVAAVAGVAAAVGRASSHSVRR